ELLPDRKRVDGRGPLAAAHADAEALTAPEVPPGDVHEDRGAVLAYQEGGAGFFHSFFLARPIQRGAHPVGDRVPREPQRQVDHRQTEVQHRSTAGKLAPLPPAEL